MKKYILTMFCIGIIITGCNKNTKYYEISNEILQKELNISTNTNGEQCFWGYGKNSEYHFFSLFCGNNKVPKNSLVIRSKNYKIKIRNIKVNTSLSVSEYPGIALQNITIEW